MTRQWTTLHTYEDIKYEFYNGIAKLRLTVQKCVMHSAQNGYGND